ncbi:MAG: SUMF1/EgtB/PvdO family nonheme iron enzyme, partial [Gammaproteobacteria bacterium]|nr:SUMF1/EgtB/PvdO family nonheme iron enzyme [Gammaproteobacteria bacterium]
ASSSWYMAARFVEELNKLDGDHRYRLPSEAEWEVAARAGSTGPGPMPVENPDEYACFINNSGDKPQVVARRKVNAFGVCDMPGNVRERVDDRYGANSYARLAADPLGPAKGFSRVRRGGSCYCPLHLLRPG